MFNNILNMLCQAKSCNAHLLSYLEKYLFVLDIKENNNFMTFYWRNIREIPTENSYKIKENIDYLLVERLSLGRTGPPLTCLQCLTSLSRHHTHSLPPENSQHIYT